MYNATVFQTVCCKRKDYILMNFTIDIALTEAFSIVVKTPVDSTTYSAPAFPQGMALGSLSEKTAILLPVKEEIIVFMFKNYISLKSFRQTLYRIRRIYNLDPSKQYIIDD